MNKNRVVLIIAFCLIAALTATAQEKKPLSNTDVISMLEAGLSESTIVLAIQQSQPNFDTSPQALIQLKNKGASPKVLDSVLQAQSSKSSTNQKPQNSDNSKQSPVMKASAYDFNFEVSSCLTSGGDSVICTYTITNKDTKDRNLFIDGNTRMIDEFGNEYPVAERILGKNKLDGYAFMDISLIPEVSVIGTLKFERVKPFSTIKALRISFLQSYSLASQSVNVDFFNIPLNGRTQSDTNRTGNSSSNDLMLGIGLYERGNVEQSFEPFSRAIANGEKVVVIIYHRINGPSLGLDDDMYVGHLHISKDTFEFRSAGSVMSLSGQLRVPYANFKIPMSKILSVKVEPRKQGRLSLELMIADDKGKEKKKTYNFYPQSAEVMNTSRSGTYWEIRCADCEQRSEVLAKLLQKFMAEATAVK